MAESDFWNFGSEKSLWRPRRASRPTWTLKSSEAKRIPLPLPRCDVLATMSEQRFLSPARGRRREGLSTLGLLARKAGDGSRRLGHGVSEGTDQDELSVFEQIHDFLVGPSPQDCRSDDDQANASQVGGGVETRERFGAAPDAREADTVGAKPRCDTEPHDVGEGVAAHGPVAVGLFQRRPDEAVTVPVIQLPGRKTSQTGDVRRGKTPGNDTLEFHRCNSKMLAQRASRRTKSAGTGALGPGGRGGVADSLTPVRVTRKPR